MKNFNLINFIAIALVVNKNFQFFVVKSQVYMNSIISYKELLIMAKGRKSLNYFVFIRRNYHCFTGNVKSDVANANQIINNTVNNNSAHGYVSAFKWAFNNFYGVKFNTKYIVSRPNEISKFTTRLTNKEISYIRKKYNEWINEDLTTISNLKVNVRHKRLGYYYVFEALLCSGMRIGELASINFRANPAHRIIESKISGNDKLELINYCKNNV